VNGCAAGFSCTGACSTAICESKTRCSTSAEYQCTAGKAAGGCSTNASYWPFQHTWCDACCDVKSCVKKCTPCNSTWCNVNPCTSKAPYVCTAGPLKNGCSSNPSYFPDQSQCYSCCDSSSCPTPAPVVPTPNPTTLPPGQCNMYANCGDPDCGCDVCDACRLPGSHPPQIGFCCGASTMCVCSVPGRQQRRNATNKH